VRDLIGRDALAVSLAFCRRDRRSSSRGRIVCGAQVVSAWIWARKFGIANK